MGFETSDFFDFGDYFPQIGVGHGKVLDDLLVGHPEFRRRRENNYLLNFGYDGDGFLN